MRLGCHWPHQPNCAEVLDLTSHGRGRSNRQVRRRSGPFSGSTGGKRRPDPHGQGSLRPSFSTSSVSMPTTRSPRLTLDSLEGTPGGACWSAQKDASASRSQYMTSSCLATSDRIVASTAVRCQLIFQAAAPHWTSSSCARHEADPDEGVSAETDCEILHMASPRGRHDLRPRLSGSETDLVCG